MDDFKAKWRPAAGWAFIVITVTITAAVVYALVEGHATVTEITPLLMAIVASLSPVVTMYVHGRTKEKIEGVQNDGIPIQSTGPEINDGLGDTPGTRVG